MRARERGGALVDQQHVLHRVLLVGWWPIRRTGGDEIDRGAEAVLAAPRSRRRPHAHRRARSGRHARGLGRHVGTHELTQTTARARGASSSCHERTHPCFRRPRAGTGSARPSSSSAAAPASASRPPAARAPRAPTSSSPAAIRTAWSGPRARSAHAAPPPSTRPMRLAGALLRGAARPDRPRPGHGRRSPLVPLLEMDRGCRCASGSATTSSWRSRSRATRATRCGPGGTLLLMGGTGGRPHSRGLGIAQRPPPRRPPFVAASRSSSRRCASTSSPPASSTRPCRPRCSATGSRSGARSCATLPIGRVVGPDDVAALAVHIMANTALTGATYDIDGGQQFVACKLAAGGITLRRARCARATRGPRAAPSRNDLGCLGDEAVLVQSKEPPDGSRARSSRPPGPSPARKWGRTASSARWS